MTTLDPDRSETPDASPPGTNDGSESQDRSPRERKATHRPPGLHDATPEGRHHDKPKKKEKKKGSATKGTKRGIETMFRTAYRTHLELSSLADTKANIMISVNGIFISILVATVTQMSDANSRLLLPAAVLLLTCAGALVFSVLAARPRIGGGTGSTQPGERTGTRNLLFFGTFVNMSEEEFVRGIGGLMSETGDLYAAMARDLYALGGVLARKYRLIRTAYTIFMYGLVLGVALLVVVLAIDAGGSAGVGS